MSTMEVHTLDTAAILMQAHDLAEWINGSADVADYLYWKQQVEGDEQIQQAIRSFDRKKQLFEECQRFGHYHPDYHAALNEAHMAQEQLEQYEAVRNFKAAEMRLDDLLYTVSSTIAGAVSDSIKVPGNNVMPKGGCGSGGCSGKCG